MGQACTASNGGHSSDRKSTLSAVGTVDVVSSFLESDYASAQDAVSTLLATVKRATSGEAYFYSVPYGRGRQAVVNGADDEERERFHLVVSSKGELVPGALSARATDIDERHVPLLKMAVEKELASRGPGIAAAVIRSAGDVEGILLVEAPSLNGVTAPTNPAKPNSAASDVIVDHRNEPPLALSVRLWAMVLGERLENLQRRADTGGLTKALNSIMKTMEKVISQDVNGSSNDKMRAISNMVPQEVLRGGISSDRVALWFYDHEAGEVVLNNSGHLDGIRVPADQSIVGDAVKGGTGQIICVPDVNADHRFNRSVDERTGFTTKSTICVPIIPPRRSNNPHTSFKESGELTVVQLTNGSKKNDTGERAPINHFDLVCAEGLQTSVLPTMLQIRDDFMQFCEMERQRDGLQNVVTLISEAESVPEVSELVEKEVVNVMDCECCTFFFIDLRNNEVWAPATPVRPQGIRVNIGDGLVGHVAKLAAESADSTVLTTNDPASCPYWMGDVSAEFVTRNLMTAPVWSGGRDRRLLGLIQILNKKIRSRKMTVVAGRNNSGQLTGQKKTSVVRSDKMSVGPNHDPTGKLAEDSSAVPGFTPADEKLLETLAQGVGSHLDRLLVDMMWTKAELDMKGTKAGEEICDTPGMMNEYYRVGNNGRNSGRTVYRTTHWTFSVMATEDDEIDDVEARVSRTRTSFMRDLFAATADPEPHADVRNWTVDYWALTDQQMFKCLVSALRQCDVFDELEIPEANLYNFFFAIKATYSTEVPFHNFLHAMSTLHYAFKLYKDSGVAEVMATHEMFAVLIGALCHDCDHRGCNNAFEICSRSELALRYNDSSPLENHHCAKAFEVAFSSEPCLHRQGTKGTLGTKDRIRVAGETTVSNNIFKALNAETYGKVRQHIIAGILSTDMKHHGDHVALLQTFSLNSVANETQSQFLVELLLHSADISNPFMPHEISVKWGKLVAEEFTMQVEKEAQLGMPVTAFMAGLKDPIAQAKSQKGFIDFVIVPLTDPLFNRIFPDLKECANHLQENKASVQLILDEVRSVTSAKK